MPRRRRWNPERSLNPVANPVVPSSRELEVPVPMPPATSRRALRDPRPQTNNDLATDAAPNTDLFTDPMMGAALSFYIDKDVQDKERVSQVITVSIFFFSAFRG
jgi:hypothetical protein